MTGAVRLFGPRVTASLVWACIRDAETETAVPMTVGVPRLFLSERSAAVSCRRTAPMAFNDRPGDTLFVADNPTGLDARDPRAR